ncbi:MAG: hypothetical protein GF411_20560 [Candidatus Lokiarchaeota archaeon]|nr:hypothetical protein [Candidatus Lokiarchaeota archaeon]
MKKLAYADEDLTSSVKEVIKEAEEMNDKEVEAEYGEISDIADKMEMDDEDLEGEAEDTEITFEYDALVNLVGEDKAQILYDKCEEKGPGVPLTIEDVEECCPEAEEMTPEEGELEGYEEGMAVGAEEAAEGPDEVEEFEEGFEEAVEGEGEGEEDDIEAVGYGDDGECPESGEDECPESGEDECPEAGMDSTGAMETGAVPEGGEQIMDDEVEAGEDEDPHAAALARKGEDEDPHAAALARKD